jgi:hypothetical protein
MDSFAQSHVCSGRNPLRIGGNTADLRNDVPAWSAIWAELRDELLPQFIRENPGRRPAAFTEFDAAYLPAREEDESEVEWLFRCGLIEPDELDAIRKKAQDLAAFNRGREKGGPNSHYIPPDDIHLFAIDMGLLTPEEAEILTV